MLLGSTLGYVSNAGGILVSGLACAFFFARIEAKTKRGFVLIMMFFGPVFIIYALIVSDMLWRWLAPKE